MDTRETAQRIDQAAAEWAARLDRASLTASEGRELDAWLQGDIRRQGALLRARAILVPQDRSTVDALPAPTRLRLLPRQNHVPKPVRKGWTRFGGAMAACAALMILVTSLVDTPKAYATVKGEIRTLPLGYGSTVTLNTDTRIKVHDDGSQPRIRVLQGEIYVQSEADARHSLIVEVDGRRMRAAHAAFIVSKLQGLPELVTVRDGRVELEGLANTPKIIIASNERVSLPASARTGPQLTKLSPDEIDRQLAWREGKLAFHGESLVDAAKAFSRYSDTQLVIGDPALAGKQVIGLYAANNPAGFARDAAKVLDARVERSGSRIVIVSKH